MNLSSAGDMRWFVLLAAPALMAAEYAYGRLTGRALYDARETLATFVISIGNRIINGVLGAAALWPLSVVHAHRLFDIPLRGVWIAVLFLAVEFCYYWHHVAMHRMKWFWASHLVHHSATRFNLSAAVRLGWGGNLLGGVIFYLPLAWIGFAPKAIAATLALGLLYQFLLHLAAAPRLGALEWVLNTPAHHRVHHASNAACLDRNFGGTLIVFDRLFGTFAEAPGHEPLVFGLKNAAVSPHKPFTVLLSGWRALAAEWGRAVDWRGHCAALFGRP